VHNLTSKFEALRLVTWFIRVDGRYGVVKMQS
jgi:hypothetical protein